MTMHRALVGGVLVVALLAMGLISVLGVLSINRSVLRNAQETVNHSLDISHSLYEQDLDKVSLRFDQVASEIDSKLSRNLLSAKLENARESLDFLVLNMCNAEGKPLAGTFSGTDFVLPIKKDPVLQRALRGKSVSGTVVLTPERMALEGGPALKNALVVHAVPDSGGRGTEKALFQWFAYPIRDTQGRVTGLIYGGRPINQRYALVDRFRDTIFGTELYRGKPLGTVTFFLDSVRVATNVILKTGKRAVGTEVSDEVREAVLTSGRIWNDRAWVVDSWYLSAYQPLRDPSGTIIGMLYVGLLEAPYLELRKELLLQFLIPVALVLTLGIAAAGFMVSRISKPLGSLQQSAEQLAEGNWDAEIAEGATYQEVHELASAFRSMRNAIRERDERLTSQNVQLERTNRNYMTTLGFVTHELKAPLAAMQSFVDLLVKNSLGEMPEKAQPVLIRVKRNCEELQDMVKNYLDLARAERGEMVANKTEIELVKDVLEASVTQTRPLFDSRNISLETEYPDGLKVIADPELLRIALNNYLSNAAKYGREGGKANMRLAVKDGEVTLSVWNEGEGFSEDEGKELFQKFTRLKNQNTRDKRGSGLGLFLCKQVLDLHQGTVSAESEPGAWARFGLSFPLGTN